MATVSGHRWVPRILHCTVATVARTGPPKSAAHRGPALDPLPAPAPPPGVPSRPPFMIIILFIMIIIFIMIIYPSS